MPTEPVSKDQAKRQLRLEGTTADDAYLDELITAAREHVETYCGVRLVAGAATMTFANFDALERLTLAPVTGITSVKYLDAAGVEQTLDPNVYEQVNVDADPLRPMIRLKLNQSWPAIRSAADAVRVAANVGYATAPTPIIRAMLMLITRWYDNRSGMAIDVRGTPTELPDAVTALLANYRR